MNTQQLDYFIAVAREKNFTKAAKQCFISQTAISLQIKALEKNLGVQLLERDKHHVELTPAGKIYLKEAEEIISKLSEARRLANIASSGIAGTLTVGFIRGYEQSNISTVLRNFHENNPNIAIHFLRSNMSTLYEQLENQECDIAYSLLPYYGKTPEDMNTFFLEKMPLYLTIYPGHPLENRQSCEYRDLSGEEFIIMQPEGRPQEETEEVLLCHDRGGFIPNIIRWEREIQTILMSVSIGLGVATVPQYAVQYYKDAPNLRFVPLVKSDGTPETLDFGICWKKEVENPLVTTYLDWIGVDFR
nr:LysR family transcriptional regulator [uncultured Mediterraneibacter sp.]